MDYTVDIRTPYVKEYVKLADKGDKGTWLKNKNNKDGSAYWESSSITTNIYDKQDQLMKKENVSVNMFLIIAGGYIC